MVRFDYEKLKKVYKGFEDPFIELIINKKNFNKNNAQLIVAEIDIDLSSDFEASIATFHIYNSFDMITSMFRFEAIKQYIFLGSTVDIGLGYGNRGREVFRGFITKVDFIFDQIDMPSVAVTAMDIKSIMMANHYAYQLKADNYGDAVREILKKSAYETLSKQGVITKIEVTDTPDKKQENDKKESAVTIDMVNESDYEFIVKAAKRFQYEFFIEYGTVYFRKAKAVKDTLMEISPRTGLGSIHVSYDITGLVETVETRSMDVGKGKLIFAQKKAPGKISKGNKAAPLIKKTKRVYIDPTVNSKKEAEYRVESILEDMSYRFGSLEATMLGLPELLPGYFIEIKGIGPAASNTFYITHVRHRFTSSEGYQTTIIGKAATMT